MFDFIAEDDKEERCGILYGIPRFNHSTYPSSYGVCEVPNRADDPSCSYAIYQSDIDIALASLKRTHRHIVGFWHTHPAPFLSGPSDRDWAAAKRGARYWFHLVFHCPSRRIVWYNAAGRVWELQDSPSRQQLQRQVTR